MAVADRLLSVFRNAYNDLYHWTARYSFLEKLISEGREMYNVVYIDPDILIIQDLHSLFERDFDYLMTISENEEQPINGAMHFVPKGKYHQVIFLPYYCLELSKLVYFCSPTQ